MDGIDWSKSLYKQAQSHLRKEHAHDFSKGITARQPVLNYTTAWRVRHGTAPRPSAEVIEAILRDYLQQEVMAEAREILIRHPSLAERYGFSLDSRAIKRAIKRAHQAANPEGE